MSLGTWWLLAVMCLVLLGAGVWVVSALFPPTPDARGGESVDAGAGDRSEDAG